MPMSAAIESMFRMTPPPPRRMSGTAAREQRKTPLTLTR
jgi:hypothetical protein